MKNSYFVILLLFLYSCGSSGGGSVSQNDQPELTLENAKNTVKHAVESCPVTSSVHNDDEFYHITGVGEWGSDLLDMGNGEQWLFARIGIDGNRRYGTKLRYAKFIFRLVHGKWILCGGIESGDGVGLPNPLYSWGETLYVRCDDHRKE